MTYYEQYQKFNIKTKAEAMLAMHQHRRQMKIIGIVKVTALAVISLILLSVIFSIVAFG